MEVVVNNDIATKASEAEMLSVLKQKKERGGRTQRYVKSVNHVQRVWRRSCECLQDKIGR